MKNCHETMDRLPLTRATTLIFIGNFPMVYPSHSLSWSLLKILVPNNQKLEISKSFFTMLFLLIFLVNNPNEQKLENSPSPKIH